MLIVIVIVIVSIGASVSISVSVSVTAILKRPAATSEYAHATNQKSPIPVRNCGVVSSQCSLEPTVGIDLLKLVDPDLPICPIHVQDYA